MKTKSKNQKNENYIDEFALALRARCRRQRTDTITIVACVIDEKIVLSSNANRKSIL